MNPIVDVPAAVERAKRETCTSGIPGVGFRWEDVWILFTVEELMRAVSAEDGPRGDSIAESRESRLRNEIGLPLVL